MSVYLDHAATTPILDAAAEAYARQMRQVGNAGSLHGSGRRARRVVEESREQIAAALGCEPAEVVFTSGGTEADNLAIKGVHAARAQADAGRRRVVVSAVEHHAVLEPAEQLAATGRAEVDLLGVDGHGRIDLDRLDELLEALGRHVSLISVMWANNEVGTVQPITEVVTRARRHGIPVHTDAVQAVGQLPVDATVPDAFTLTGHKLGGPLGVGALVVRRGLGLAAQIHGGRQERDLRSGTLDTPGIAGFAAALTHTVARRSAEATRLATLRDDLVARVRRVVPDATLNGPATDRLPGNAHLTFPGCAADSLLLLLDARGVECSTGAACSAGVSQPSHVLLAMGADETTARSALRITLGHTSTAADVDAFVAAIGPAVERARAGSVRGRRPVVEATP